MNATPDLERLRFNMIEQQIRPWDVLDLDILDLLARIRREDYVPEAHRALAFALSEGSEQRAPMGQAVIGGVITSSLLTLVVVPVVYCYMDDLAQWAGRIWRGEKKPAQGTDPATDATSPASRIESLS